MSMSFELLRNFFKKRATVLYPFKEQDQVNNPEGYRGKLAFYRERCIGCGLCFRACPSETIEMIEDDKGNRPKFYLDRCTHCQQCEDACPTKAIELTKIFDVVGFERKSMILE